MKYFKPKSHEKDLGINLVNHTMLVCVQSFKIWNNIYAWFKVHMVTLSQWLKVNLHFSHSCGYWKENTVSEEGPEEK